MQQPGRDILIFEVGGRRFGLPAANVRELVRAVALISLPGGPANVEGVFDFRGSVIPVLDIRQRLGMPAKPIGLGDQLIIGEARRRLVAIRVDRALQLVEAGASATNGDANGSDHQNSQGSAERITKLDEGLAPILDLAYLFNESEADSLSHYLPKSWADSEGAR